MRIYSVLGFFCLFGIGLFVFPYIVFIGKDVPIFSSLSGIIISIIIILVMLLAVLLGPRNNIKYDAAIAMLRLKLANAYLAHKRLHQLTILIIIHLTITFMFFEFEKYDLSLHIEDIVKSSSTYRGMQYEGVYQDDNFTRLIPLFSVFLVVLGSVFIFSVDRLSVKEKLILWMPLFVVFFHSLLFSSRMLLIICIGICLSIFLILHQFKLTKQTFFVKIPVLLSLFVILMSLPLSVRAGRMVILDFNEILYDFFGYLNGFFMWIESCNEMYLCSRDVFHFDYSHTNLTMAYGDIFRNFGVSFGLIIIFLISFMASYFSKYIKSIWAFFILIFYFNFLLFSHGRVLYEYDSVSLGMLFAYFYLQLSAVKFKNTAILSKINTQ